MITERGNRSPRDCEMTSERGHLGARTSCPPGIGLLRPRSEIISQPRSAVRQCSMHPPNRYAVAKKGMAAMQIEQNLKTNSRKNPSAPRPDRHQFTPKKRANSRENGTSIFPDARKVLIASNVAVVTIRRNRENALKQALFASAEKRENRRSKESNKIETTDPRSFGYAIPE